MRPKFCATCGLPLQLRVTTPPTKYDIYSGLPHFPETITKLKCERRDHPDEWIFVPQHINFPSDMVIPERWVYHKEIKVGV